MRPQIKEFFPSLPEKRNGCLEGARGPEQGVGMGRGTREPGVESRKTDRGCLYGWSQRVQGGKASEGSGSTQQGKAPKTSSSVERPAMGCPEGQPEVIHRPAPSMLADICPELSHSLPGT